MSLSAAAQALALEAGDDLAGQVARECVGLDQDQGPVHACLLEVAGCLETPARGPRLVSAGVSDGAGAGAASASPGSPPRSTGRAATPGPAAVAVRARVVELAQARRAAQEVLLDLVVAVRAQHVVRGLKRAPRRPASRARARGRRRGTRAGARSCRGSFPRTGTATPPWRR